MRLPALLALGLALVAGQAPADPFALERLLPPDALFVLSLPRTPAAAKGYEGSELKKLWEHPEVRAFLAPFESWLEKRRAGRVADPAGRPQPSFDELSREVSGLGLDELWELLQGPLGVAVYDLPVGPRRPLDLVFAIGAADGAALARGAAKVREALARQSGGALKEGEFQKDGVTLHELGDDAFKVFWAVLNRTLFVTTRQERIEQIAASSLKPGASLLDDPAYRGARKHVSPDESHFLSAWLGVSNVLKRYKAEIGDEGLQVLEALGVADLESAAFAVGFENGLVAERYALVGGRQDRGLPKLLAGGAGGPVHPAPAGALSWAHSSLDLAATWDALLEIARAIPGAEEEILGGLRDFEGEAGLKVRDVLGSLGSSWTTWSVFPEGGGVLPYDVTAIQLRDPEALTAAAEKIAQLLEVEVDSLPFRGRTIRLASMPLGEDYGLFLPDFFVPSFPMAWVLEGKTLYFSSNPLALKRHLLHGAEARPIAEDPRYAILAARAPAEARDAFLYADMGRWLNVVYSTIDPLAGFARDFARDPQTGALVFDLARLPLGETLSELVGASLVSKRTVPGAILLESRSKAGLSPTSVVAGVALLAGAGAAAFASRGGAEPIEVDGVAGNELLVSVNLQLLKQAQETFKNSDSDRNGVADYWTRDVAGLWGVKDASGQPVFLVDPALASADPDGAARYGLAPAPRSGYFVKAMVTDADGEPYAKDGDQDGSAFTNPAKWGVAAWPSAYGLSGRMTFIVSQDGKVWKKDAQGKAADRWPGKDPAAEGWEPAE